MTSPSDHPLLADIRTTGRGFPTQYEGEFGDGTEIYVRYRHGGWSVYTYPAGTRGDPETPFQTQQEGDDTDATYGDGNGYLSPDGLENLLIDLRFDTGNISFDTLEGPSLSAWRGGGDPPDDFPE